MSSSVPPPSPPRPSSASATTTTASTSTPTTTTSSSTALPRNAGVGGGPSTASSTSSPPPPLQFQPLPGVRGGRGGGVHQQPPYHPHPGAGGGGGAAATQQFPPPATPQNHPAGALPSPTNPSHLPTATQQAQTAQARAALVASLGNALDTELQSRAALLHGGAAAIARQERDVHRALEELRREDDRLLKVLGAGSRRVKELGDVQNWAERLERDFLVLEETVRLVEGRRGSGSGSGSEGSWSGSESGSGSWSGSEEGSVAGDADGDVRMGEDDAPLGKGKGKQVAVPSEDDAMDLDPALVPLPADEALEAGTSSAVINVPGPEQTTTAALASPGGTSWFKRFIWRG